jgi:hypothetical protein
VPTYYKDIPLVFIYNNIESFFEFLHRAERRVLPQQEYTFKRQYSKGDRALLSLGDYKLVFVSAPVPHADDLYRRFGYLNTSYVTPANPSPWLSLDILQEPPLLNRLVEYAGPERTVQLIAYATTPQFCQLVNTLQTKYGLNVLLPENVPLERLWLRDYIDTKSGFRTLASRWLPNAETLLPQGFICRDLAKAAMVVHWFCTQNKSCVVKADGGESGIGHHIFQPTDLVTPEDILRTLQPNPFLHDDQIIVEEYIHSSELLSPSLEVYVPPLGTNPPEITYLSNQLFLGFSDFYGLLVSQELLERDWYPTLAESGLRIAAQLQQMGYVGHFDLDTIVDDEGRIYLLELNSRRTAGTHVHEFGRFFFGPNYLKNIVLLSINKTSSGHITSFDELRHAIDDLLYPMQSERRGIIPAVTSILGAGEFGCIIAAPTTQEALGLYQSLVERLQSPGPEST